MKLKIETGKSKCAFTRSAVTSLLLYLSTFLLLSCASLTTSLTSDQLDHLRTSYVGKHYWAKGPLKRYVDSDEAGVPRLTALTVTDLKTSWGVWLYLTDSTGRQAVVQLFERDEAYDSLKLRSAVENHLWAFPRQGIIDSMTKFYSRENVLRALDGQIAVGDGVGLIVTALGNPDHITPRAGGAAFDQEWAYTQAREKSLVVYLKDWKVVDWTPR